MLRAILGNESIRPSPVTLLIRRDRTLYGLGRIGRDQPLDHAPIKKRAERLQKIAPGHRALLGDDAFNGGGIEKMQPSLAMWDAEPFEFVAPCAACIGCQCGEGL